VPSSITIPECELTERAGGQVTRGHKGSRSSLGMGSGEAREFCFEFSSKKFRGLCIFIAINYLWPENCVTTDQGLNQQIGAEDV